MNRVAFLKFNNVKRFLRSDSVDILIPMSKVNQIMIFNENNKVIFDTSSHVLTWKPNNNESLDVHTYINKELSSGKTIIEFN